MFYIFKWYKKNSEKQIAYISNAIYPGTPGKRSLFAQSIKK